MSETATNLPAGNKLPSHPLDHSILFAIYFCKQKSNMKHDYFFQTTSSVTMSQRTYVHLYV